MKGVVTKKFQEHAQHLIREDQENLRVFMDRLRTELTEHGDKRPQILKDAHPLEEGIWVKRLEQLRILFSYAGGSDDVLILVDLFKK